MFYNAVKWSKCRLFYADPKRRCLYRDIAALKQLLNYFLDLFVENAIHVIALWQHFTPP